MCSGITCSCCLGRNGPEELQVEQMRAHSPSLGVSQVGSSERRLLAPGFFGEVKRLFPPLIVSLSAQR